MDETLMPKPSPHPKHPVRVLRKLLGFNSANSFAEFTGIPAETIRNLEQGRRSVTAAVARQIGIATGVAPTWLQSGTIARGKPMFYEHEELTKDVFEKYRGLNVGLDTDPNDGNEAEAIDDICEGVTALLRVAARKGRFAQCMHVLKMSLREAEKQFRLRCDHETTADIDKRFGPSKRFGKNNELDWSNFYSAWRLLSPTSRFKWDAELAQNRTAKSSLLLDDIENLREVVEQSFAIKPKRWKRSSGSRVSVSAR